MSIRLYLPPLLVATLSGFTVCQTPTPDTNMAPYPDFHQTVESVETKQLMPEATEPVMHEKKHKEKKEHAKEHKKHKEEAKKVEKVNTEQLMEEIYQGKSGFGISQEETETIQQKGGAPTYGEILYDSLKVLLDSLNITSKDVFYDLGCGIGKVAMQAYLDYPFKKVVGIELSDTRLQIAKEQKEKLKEKGMLDKNRKLDFIKGDITQANIKDATVVYMCSTCYSPECMNSMVEKLSRLKPGLIVITLKALPTYQKYNFTLVNDYNLPMTWTKDGGSPVYVYKLEHKAPAKKEAKKETKKEGKKSQEAKPKKATKTKKNKEMCKPVTE